MGIRLDKPWRELGAETVKALPGQLGVFQLADQEGRILFIGYAGGHALFGLRSAVEEARRHYPDAKRFRVEVTMQYQSRYRELLMLHQADFGALPEGNRAAPPSLGRLSPL
jgi:flavorubredoxin